MSRLSTSLCYYTEDMSLRPLIWYKSHQHIQLTTIASLQKCILLLLLLCSGLMSEEVQISPLQNNSESVCSEDPCLSLPQLIHNSSKYLRANTTMIFLPGNHSLESKLLITNISVLTIFSVAASISDTIIICDHFGRFEFDNIGVVNISGLTFLGCTGNKLKSVDQLTLENSSFVGREDVGGTSVYLVETSGCLLGSSFKLNNGDKFHSRSVQSYFDGPSLRVPVGGAILATNSNVIIIDSRFEENCAGLGGCIFSELHSNITVFNTMFERNLATHGDYYTGGGVLYTMNGSTLTIHSSCFSNNKAPGGGVVVSKDDINIVIVNSHFINNSALGGGGGVISALNNINLTISHSVFNNNKAHGSGGVLYAEDNVNITIISSQFINNHIPETNTGITLDIGGGVVYAEHSINIHITKSHFMNNSARGADGGGVLSVRSDSSIAVNHSKFTNNTVLGSDKGGVISVEFDVIVNVFNSEFINNVALGSTGGGVIGAENNINVTMTHSKFINNNAFGDGGGVLYASYGVAISLIHNEFINNSALNEFGGGVLYASSNIDQERITILNSKFINNSARFDGGVLSLDGVAVVIITASNFTDNRASRGGAVTIQFEGSLAVSNSYFGNNLADINGGVLYGIQNPIISIFETMFNTNRANKNGGILYMEEATAFIKNCHFSVNTASGDGGVVASLQGNLTVDWSEFDTNSVGNDGGVFHVYQEVINLSGNTFHSNSAMNDGGVIHTYGSIANVLGCSFQSNNAVKDGGAVSAYQGSLSISEDTNFSYNAAHKDGGAIHAFELHITIEGCSYIDNRAGNRGGVWFIYQSNVTIVQSIVSHSEATDGGVIYANQGNITMQNTSCIASIADKGGALHTDQSTVSIYHSTIRSSTARKVDGGAWLMEDGQALLQDVSFINNSANRGGALSSSYSNLLLNSTTFKQNVANNDGGAIYLSKCNLNSFKSLLINLNRANIGVIYLLGSVANFYGQTTFFNNFGSCLLSNSIAIFTGHAFFYNSSELIQSHINTTEIREGGAITAFKSDISFNNTITMAYNFAENGGAVHATESKVYINGEMTVAYNSANDTGGGVYLDMSEIHCQGNSSLKLTRNFAPKKGGGVHAISSTINVNGNFTYNESVVVETTYSRSLLHFIENEAEEGGGLCLEMNSKLYILKFMPYYKPLFIVHFTNNSANHGGAIYVSDDSNLGMCNPNYNSHYKAKECFFQILAIYSFINLNFSHERVNIQNIFFSENYADASGSSLYGGLIDRCKLQHFSEFQNIYHINSPIHSSQDILVNGISYMKTISNINMSEVSSGPVKLCFCKKDRPDCHYQPDPIRVIKGKRFFVEIVAVDQVDHSVSATIHSILFNTGGGLGAGQATQTTNRTCTELNFNLFSPNDKEELIMYAEGPCVSSPLSQRRLTIQFTACDSCPVGFKKHVDETTMCEWICDSILKPYITKCNASTEQLEREGNFWISYVNTSNNVTSGYLIYVHCPLNYCKPPTTIVEINLNIPNGADVQCDNGRSGMLCGTCQSNLSLSLGSSHCISCSTSWPTILIVLTISLLAGIALVSLLLVLNLTVAVGTLNGITFYVNIIAGNVSTFLPFSKPNFATVFISWLNLEIGFDICFFAGMDAYWKTLLQLAFPMYVIFLVAMVIFVIERSTKFAHLVAKRNPVATLATLILLSYTKFLPSLLHFLLLSLIIRMAHVKFYGFQMLPSSTSKESTLFSLF